MFENNNVTQSNINADKVVGRDDNSTHNYYIHNETITYKDDMVLKSLLEQHEKEKDNNPEYRQFSEELNNFFRIKQVENLRDLSQKLKDAERDYLIDCALEAKERVTKKIHKFSLYRSAQDIYTYLLTNIRTTFIHSLTSKIKSGKFENYEIDDIVNTQIIEPFYHNVQYSSLYIDKDELYGLLYLLTGNCHISWD